MPNTPMTEAELNELISDAMRAAQQRVREAMGNYYAECAMRAEAMNALREPWGWEEPYDAFGGERTRG